MFIFANFLIALGRVLEVVITILTWLIFIRAIISWVNPDPFNPIVQFLYRVTEPILAPIRRIIPLGNLTFDFSPIIAFLILMFLRYFLVNTLLETAWRLKGIG